MTTILAFTLAGLVTYALRSTMTLFGQQLLASPRVESVIGLVSPAALTAIVASAMFLDHGQLTRPHLLSTLAVCCAIAAVHKTNNISMALFVGLPIYWFGALAGFA